MTKQELRKLYLKKRQAIGEGEYLQLNHSLCETFFANIDFSFTKVVHTFLPIPEKREPDSWLIVDRIRREHPHIRLSIPRVNTSGNTLENFYFEGLHQIETSTWGVPEPRQGIPTPIEKIDMVLVPLLAYDEKGHRLGYGKGYYDRLLIQCRADTRKIGLSFFEPVKELPVHDADIRLDGCVTPSGFRLFRD